MDYPPEVFELLEWFQEHPEGKWDDVPQRLIDCGWDFVKRDDLHDDLGTIHVHPGVSGFGRNVIRLKSESTPEAETGEQLAGMTWQEAAKRLERLHESGIEFTSQHDISRSFKCSPATINKALDKTPSLHVWANIQPKQEPELQPKTVPDFVIGNTGQSVEIDPVDAAAISEFIDKCKDSETKSWFLALPLDKQIEYLNRIDEFDEI